MRSSVTKFVGLGIFFIFGVSSSWNAVAQGRGHSAHQVRPEFSIINTPGWTANSPIYSQPFNRQQPGDNAKLHPNTAVQLWPSPITYSRVTDFITPFVQSDLRFGVQYTYTFHFSLRARSSDGTRQPIPDGWYLLNMAVVLKDADSIFRPAAGVSIQAPYDRFVTSTSLLVLVSNGTFSRQIRLRFPNVTATTLINHLFVELVPLAEECEKTLPGGHVAKFKCIGVTKHGHANASQSVIKPLPNYKPFMIEMPFVPYVPSGAAQPNPDDAPDSPHPLYEQSLSEFINQAKLHQASKPNPPKPIDPLEFANQENLHSLNLAPSHWDDYQRRWMKGQKHSFETLFKKLMAEEGVGAINASDDVRPILPALCNALIDANVDPESKAPRWWGKPSNVKNGLAVRIAHACRSEPEKYLSLSRVTHIEKIDTTRPLRRIFSRSMNYVMMANFMVNRSQSRDTFTGLSLRPTAILFKAVEAFGLPMPAAFDITHTVNNTNSRSRSENAIGSLTTWLDFNFNAMNIPVAGATTCLMVKPSAEADDLIRGTWSIFSSLKKDQPRGLYICDESISKSAVNEIFVHIFERGRDSSTIDPYDPLTQSINFSLRGDRDLSTFFYLVRSHITPDHDNRTMSFQMLAKAEEHFKRTPFSHSGMVVNPINLSKKEFPSFTQRAFLGYSEHFGNGGDQAAFR